MEWHKAQVTIERPDGGEERRTRTLSGIDAMLGGGEERTVYSMSPSAAGVHHLRIALRGRTEAGDAVTRMLDRTFRAAEAGQGKRYEHQVDPFIRRESGGLW